MPNNNLVMQMMPNNNFVLNNNNMINNNNKIVNIVGITCTKQLGISGEYRWKIKIIKTSNREIMVGVAPFDFNMINPDYEHLGWFLYCKNSTLCSGPPHNYFNKITNFNIPKEEITLIMNMDRKTLKFIIDDDEDDDNNISYEDIPLDKPLTPIVFLYNENDSVQIIKI